MLFLELDTAHKNKGSQKLIFIALTSLIFFTIKIQKITEKKNYFKIIIAQSLSYFKSKYAKIIKDLL